MENKGVGVQRESWGSRAGLILAAAGSAIGLGNIWRFPYLLGEGGGAAFLIIYLIAIALVGFAVMLCEFAVGRGAQANAIGAFRKLAPGTPWWLVGAMGVLAPFVILSFYGVVAGWSMAYVWMTAKGVFAGLAPDQVEGIFGAFISDATQPIIWQALFMIFTVAIVIAGVKDGIEKWSRILIPAIFVIFILLIIRGLTLEGAMAGVSFLVTPDFSAVDGGVILAAFGQAFFSLSLGMGIMITYGSYIDKKENLASSVTTIIGLDTTAALLASFAIFPALFAVGLEPAQGPGLVFVLLPTVFEALPFGTFFGVIFFLLVTIAALTSGISLLEVCVAFVKEQFNVPRKVATIVLGIAIFLLGVTASLSMGPWDHITLPFPGHGQVNLFDFYDLFTANILLTLGAMLVCIYAVWVWKPENLFKEITNNGELNYSWLPIFKVVAGIIAPIVILVVLLNGIGLISL